MEYEEFLKKFRRNAEKDIRKKAALSMEDKIVSKIFCPVYNAKAEY